ncbi:hypothetical protein QQX98_000036 [Neonectria punicea]|uniref:Uncharacterized protein n=1 Tax=Neonectria punicea TaxID=979145 RepID=A0ABR1HVZ7_9HYPO
MASVSTLATPAKLSPIATHSKACLRLFESLSDLITSKNAPIDGFTQTQVLDHYGQLRVWASNIGALQPRHTASSLDYRLRDAPKIAAEVVSLLGDLAETLEDGKSLTPVMES